MIHTNNLALTIKYCLQIICNNIFKFNYHYVIILLWLSLFKCKEQTLRYKSNYTNSFLHWNTRYNLDYHIFFDHFRILLSNSVINHNSISKRYHERKNYKKLETQKNGSLIIVFFPWPFSNEFFIYFTVVAYIYKEVAQPEAYICNNPTKE